MGFRHFTSIFNEISEIRQSNLLVNTKLVFSDVSLLVHLHMLEAGGLWWTKCRDLEIPPDEIVYLFPDDSINFGLEMMHELYRDCKIGCLRKALFSKSEMNTPGSYAIWVLRKCT